MKARIILYTSSISFALLFMFCSNKKTENRLADLESRVSVLEKKNGITTTSSGGNESSLPTITNDTNTTKPDGPLPVAEFDTTSHDFGTVKEGEKVTFTYKIKNTGEVPLIIQSANPSCGCTVPTWTKDPIPVGGSGFVTAEFDTNGKSGMNNKTITVVSNAWPKTQTLTFKANVIAKAK